MSDMTIERRIVFMFGPSNYDFQQEQNVFAPAADKIARFARERGWIPTDMRFFSYPAIFKSKNGEKVFGTTLTPHEPNAEENAVSPRISVYKNGDSIEAIFSKMMYFYTARGFDAYTVSAVLHNDRDLSFNEIKPKQFNITKSSLSQGWMFDYDVGLNIGSVGIEQFDGKMPQVIFRFRGSDTIYKQIDWPTGVPRPEDWNGFTPEKCERLIKSVVWGDMSYITESMSFLHELKNQLR